MAANMRTLVRLILGEDLQREKRQTKRREPPRNPRYIAWIRTFPCLACGSTCHVEAAHTGSDGGMSQKASDYSCVPLCQDCHTSGASAYHRIGKLAFERRHGVALADLVKILNRAWRGKKSRK